MKSLDPRFILLLIKTGSMILMAWFIIKGSIIYFFNIVQTQLYGVILAGAMLQVMT